MSDDSHLPTPLAHGRWAGDRVGRSAREAGASLKTLSKRATLTEQQRHRLGSGSFEWRQPEKQRSQRGGLFWTVFPRGAVQNGAQLDRIAARESEDLLFNAHTSPAMCVELTGGPPVRWFVIYLSIRLGPRVWRERGEHTVSYDGFDTASASNLGGGDDGKVAAPAQSSTQKTASHLIRLG